MKHKTRRDLGPTPSEKTFSLSGLLNIEEFAFATGWSKATVRSKIWKREIEYVRMGRSIRFRPETVQRLIEDNTVPAIER